MWGRDLDMVVPMWQGADDLRARPGAGALAALVDVTDAPRVTVPVPADGSPSEGGVRNLSAVVDTWHAQVDVLQRHRPERLLTLGGDCAVEVAPLVHLRRRYGGRLFVLWFDAHGDLNTPGSSPSGTAHGMPLRRLLDPDPEGPVPGTGCLSTAQVALVGTRDLDPAEAAYVAERGITLLDVPAVHDRPARVADLPPPGAAVYVHLDLDVLDPSELPAVAVPTPDGLRPGALASALTAVHARHEVVGVGITEYVPEIVHDRGVLTGVLASLGLTSGSTA